MTKPTALITGVTGQDGSYLAELLLDKGYDVHAIVRRASTFNTGRIEHIRDKLTLHYGDLADGGNITNLVHDIKPQEIYNLGAQSHVRVSFDAPEYTGDVDGLGALRLLEAIRRAGLVDSCRYYQASSSEMFGKVQEVPRWKPRNFGPAAPMVARKCMLSGLRSITESPTEYMRRMASSSTTNPPAVAKPSLPAKSPAPQPGSSLGYKTRSRLETSTRNGTGVTRKTTSK